MKNKLLVGIGIVTLSLGAYLFFLSQQEVEEAKGGTIVRTADFLGTGTSTAGTVNFNLTPATTTSNILIVGGNVDTIDFDVFPESASTTNHLNIQFQKSSHSRCGDITANAKGWVDAVSTNAVSTHITTLTTATSTVAMTFPATTAGPAYGKKYTLTNVNGHCVRAFIGAQSVNLYIQAQLKTLSY